MLGATEREADRCDSHSSSLAVMLAHGKAEMLFFRSGHEIGFYP